MGTNKISGAEAVIRCLLEEGVNLVYGYLVETIMPVYDELYKFKDELQHVLVRRTRGNSCCTRICKSNRKVEVR
jgi:acetolactate synthase-1/2/3 large subunit